MSEMELEPVPARGMSEEQAVVRRPGGVAAGRAGVQRARAEKRPNSVGAVGYPTLAVARGARTSRIEGSAGR